MKSRFAASVALLVTGILCPVLWNASPARAANSYAPFDGEITVIINENDARLPLALGAQTAAVDFILGKTK
jgi:hypothetical protein